MHSDALLRECNMSAYLASLQVQVCLACASNLRIIQMTDADLIQVNRSVDHADRYFETPIK